MFKFITKLFKSKEEPQEIESPLLHIDGHQYKSLINLWTCADTGEVFLDVDVMDIEVESLRDFAQLLHFLSPSLRSDALELFGENITDMFGEEVGVSVVDLILLESLILDQKLGTKEENFSNTPLIAPSQIFQERKTPWSQN